MKYEYIAIEGNIGIGKTTLANIYANELGFCPMLEEFEDNEFLPKFYANSERYALALEVTFLADRYKQITSYFKGANKGNRSVVSDYFFDRTNIFAQNNLAISELSVFRKLFDILCKGICKPDLLIFLHSDIPKIQRQIISRGRPYEQKIAREYLENVQKQYINYITSLKNYKVVSVDVGDMDFVKNLEDRKMFLKLLDHDYDEGINEVRLSA